MTSMRTHEIDLWYNASAANYPVASKIAATRVLLTPFTQYSMIGFNVHGRCSREVAVRRALAYATDRKRLIDDSRTASDLPGEGDQPAFSWAHDPRLRSIPFDPARARAMSTRPAGSPAGRIRAKGGRRMHLEFATISGSSTGDRGAVLLQAAWKSVGIDAEIHPYPIDKMFANFAPGRDSADRQVRRRLLVVGERDRSRRFHQLHVRSGSAARSKLCTGSATPSSTRRSGSR